MSAPVGISKGKDLTKRETVYIRGVIAGKTMPLVKYKGCKSGHQNLVPKTSTIVDLHQFCEAE